jgi:hypothetical protein
MCWNKKEKMEISLEKLYDKIRESKEMYEDKQYYCRIMLVQGTQTTPLAYQGIEKDVNSAINAIPIRLEQELALTSPATIRFEYILISEIGSLPLKKNMTILWEENVNVTDIIERNKDIVEKATEVAKQLGSKMDDFKIPNK